MTLGEMKCGLLPFIIPASYFGKPKGLRVKVYRGQTTDDGRQRTASQIVKWSNSQMVMNGLNGELTIYLISHLTSCQLTNPRID
jgi:hypothetical protein